MPRSSHFTRFLAATRAQGGFLAAFPARFIATCVMACAAPYAVASAASVDKPAPAAASKPAPAPKAAPTTNPSAVPADVRARIAAKLPGVNPADVAASPIPGLYEVIAGAQILYATPDGKYVLAGNIFDVDRQENLTAARWRDVRMKALAAISESNMIVFGPPNAKMTVTVFTDIDCGYCRKFHSHIAEMNKAGVRVRYLMYPRTGPDTESWAKAEQVWCSADRRDALSRAKKGEPLKAKACGDAAIKSQYELGSDMGVEGTPAVFTQNGDQIGGYLTPAELVQAIQESSKTPVAAR
jgi:thiol:disulfide interchange protein DsbC